MNAISLQGSSGNAISITAAGSGPVLLLLHGFPLDHRMWSPQLRALSAWFHVIAPEFRGFGQSSLTEQAFSIADLADDIELVRRRLATGRQIILCGLSMGGYVALEYWRRHGAHLAGLVLSNTKPEADSQEARSARLLMCSTAREQGAWKAVSGMLDKLLTEAHLDSGGEVVKTVEQMMRGCRVETICAAQHAMAQRADFLPLLPSVQVPTLVITGEYDSIAPPATTRKWAALLPNSQCAVIRASAHLTPLECSEEFNSRIAEFAQAIPTTASKSISSS